MKPLLEVNNLAIRFKLTLTLFVIEMPLTVAETSAVPDVVEDRNCCV